MGYRQLSIEEREVIMMRNREGYPAVWIARELGRSCSTVTREMKRNRSQKGYRVVTAHRKALSRRGRGGRQKRLGDGKLRKYVDRGLRKYWSPEQIAARVELDHPGDPQMRVCHETIYQFIAEAAQRGVTYECYLRQGHRRNSYAWRGKKRFKRIRNYKRIEERPKVVEERSRIGDWESDTVRGPNSQQAGIATHVERRSRYVVARKLNSRKAAAYNEATIKAFRARPDLPAHTFTVDHGMEFSQFKQLEQALNTDVYFATPYHAWERGSNENANGLLRQFFPKKSDLSGVHPREISRAVRLLNNRPRKTLGYRTPAEVMQRELLCT